MSSALRLRHRFLVSVRSERILLGSLAVLTLVAVVLTAVSWPSKPVLAAERSGDRHLLEQLGASAGHHHLSVALVDLGSPSPVRLADVGASPETPYEVGSFTKALTGLAIADSVQRGEVTLSEPVSRYLPIADSPGASVTLRELVTHSAGYPRLGRTTARRGTVSAFTRGNPYTTTTPQMTDEVRRAQLSGRGTYAYSNLGAAVAGQAVAAAVGSSYPELMRSRVFVPLQMTHTVVADHRQVAAGYAANGQVMAPWIFHAYAPAGGVVSTSGDLAVFAQAVLQKRAPGLAAFRPLAQTDQANTRIGIFWHETTLKDGSHIVLHNGQTGGYSSFVGFDLHRRRAIVVLSDVSLSVDALAMRLLIKA